MDRRQFLGTAGMALGALGITTPDRLLAQRAPPSSTRWHVQTSEALDAVAFLGALSGGELYLKRYDKEAAEFGALLPDAIRADLTALRVEADRDEFGLLWPNFATILSGASVKTMAELIAAVERPDPVVRAPYAASPYWDEGDWRWFTAAAPRLRKIFAAMQKAGFPAYRAKLVGATLDAKAAELERALSSFDVIQWQRKLTGRDFDPNIHITLLYFSEPHGVRVQGQHFLQSTAYGLTTTLRIAAHEMLHPPIDMKGRVASAIMATLGKDELITRIVRDHDPRWGYTSLEGYLNEDICQALDQLISEALGAARNPADRWRKADDGMHVLAAGLYGLLRQDKWAETGGSIEAWLDRANASGRLSPASLHTVAARILERPIDQLWPLQGQTG